MSQNPVPARGVSPGRILSREIEARGWTQKDLAEIMGRPPQTISEIVNAKKQITPETALELAEALGTSAEFWTNLENSYQLHLARERATRGDSKPIGRKSVLYTLAPVAELKRRGWIRPVDSVDDLEKQVFAFLRISEPDELPKVMANLRASQTRGPEASAQVAWVRRVEHVASRQAVGRFDLRRLKRAVRSILACARQAEDVSRVPPLLARLGVHFVIVPHLDHTYLDGAAFYLDDRPVLALTLRYDRIDAFWFTLTHELAHVVREHPPVYLENLYPEDGGPDGLEAEANDQASDWLLEPEPLARFVRDTQPRFSRRRIEAFAASQGRHAGIVVGRLQHDGLVEYSHLRALLVKVKAYLADWVDSPGPQ